MFSVFSKLSHITTRILTAVLRLGFDVERKFGLYYDINESSKNLNKLELDLACSGSILKCAQTPRIGLNV